MSCYILTADFFIEDFAPVPKLNFKSVNNDPANPSKCMHDDREFRRRIEVNIQDHRFTLRIVCPSAEARDAALDIEQQYLKTYRRHGRMGLQAQLEMFHELSDLCRCTSALVASRSSTPMPGLARTWSHASSSSSSGRSITTSAPTNGADKTKKGFTYSPHGAKFPAGRRHEKSTTATASPFHRTTIADLLFNLDPTERKRYINEELILQIRDGIDPDRERREGCIYLIASPTHPGSLLIGCTTKDSPELIESEARLCLKDAHLVAFTPHLRSIRHIMRLVERELRFHARDLHCTSCNKRHKNWYEISSETAEAVVLRWADWTTSDTYNHFDGQLVEKWKSRSNLAKLLDLEPAVVGSNGLGGSDSDACTWDYWTRNLMTLDSPTGDTFRKPLQLIRPSGHD